MPTSFPTKQAAVDATFGAGTKIVGEVANVADAPNDKFDPSKPVDTVVNPRTVKRQNGTVISVQRADGTPDTLTLSDAKPADAGTTGGGKGGVGYEVLEGGKTTPKATGSAITDWDRLDAKGAVIPKTDTTTPAVALHDPKAPAGSQPYTITGGAELGDPSTWTPIREDQADPNSRVIGLYDPKSQKVAASVSQSTTDKDSDPSKWKPVYRTPGDPNSGIIGQQDTVNHVLHPVAALPDGTTVVTTPNAIYVVDKDKGTSTKVQDIDPKSPFQSVVIGNQVYKFDPKDGSYTAGPIVHPDIKDAAQNPMVWKEDDAGNGKYVYPPGVTPAASIANSTTLKNLEWYDNQGNLIVSRPNSNYQPTAITAPTPNANARLIAIPDPSNPSQLKWVPNEGRITASDALKQLATSLTGSVVQGDISQDEAIALINAANARQTNDINAQQNATTAAGDVLTNARGNATTGAGLLQQRVQAATGTLQSILGNALGNKNFGAAGGLDPNIGTNLIQGLQGWTADLMGGQSTMDSAARMVQAADPQSNLHDPNTQTAIAALTQMLDKYQQLNGGVPHPLHAASDAAAQSTQAGGVVAPQTYNLNDIQWNQPPQNAPGRTMGPGGVITGGTGGTVAPVAAVQATPAVSAVAPIAQAPGQNYGASTAYQPGWYPGMGTIPQPLPQFVAPVTS